MISAPSRIVPTDVWKSRAHTRPLTIACPAKDAVMLTKAVLDRYRCPERFLDFRLDGESSKGAGSFQFGADTAGNGRVSRGVDWERAGRIPDILAGISIDEAHVVLPFDPDEVIDDLRRERYAAGQWGGFEQALKKFYYRVRCLTNLALRRQIKMFYSGRRKKASFPHWPVDTTVENICEVLLLASLRATRVDHIPFVWFWPEGARGAVVMTHDVETDAGRNFCADLLDINDSFEIKAAFAVVPEDRYVVDSGFLDQLRNRGSEIMVQDLNHDGRLYDERKEFLRRVALINRYGREFGATGFRAAVLYRKPEWFGDLEFSYDTSIPNVAHLDPQYGGCCSVLPYFIGNILELPVTTVQDYTLFHLLNQCNIDLWRVQFETILSKHGLANFIVHPDYIIEPGKRSVYEALLVWLGEMRQRQNLWFALPRDIDSWWRTRSRMSVVQDTGTDTWRVVGEGAERAVVAFAKAIDGRLVYEMADTASQKLSANP